MKRGIYATVALSILGATLWTMRRAHDKKADAQISQPALASGEAAKVVIDQAHHTATVVQRRPAVEGGGTTTTKVFLPPRASAIIVGDDGRVRVEARRFGTEISPYVGLSLGSDARLRAAVGLNLLYWQRWELGAGIVASNDIHDTRVYAALAYNAYGNILISLGMDHKQTALLIVGLKF